MKYKLNVPSQRLISSKKRNRYKVRKVNSSAPALDDMNQAIRESFSKSKSKSKARKAINGTYSKGRIKTLKSYKRRAKKTGSSIQATIPSEFAKKLNLEPGDNVVYKLNELGQIVIEKEEKAEVNTELDKDFIQALSQGMAEYDEALRDLVER